MLYGAIEAGGTKFVCAVADESLDILERISIPTTVPKETMDQVITFFKQYNTSIISVGSFGPIDVDKKSSKYGYITNTPKEGWRDFDFKGTLEREFNVPILWTTDVNAAAYGEFKLGAAQNSESCLYLTVGTGIGGGLVRNGEIINGYTHPEMGHILVRKNERDDFEGTCPSHGDCLEGLASGFAIEKRYGKNGKDLEESHPIWDYVSNYLAQALMTYTLTMSPEKIILGGGVMKQQHLLDLIREKFELIMNNYMEYPIISEYINTPGLGDDAGILGCLSLAKDELNS